MLKGSCVFLRPGNKCPECNTLLSLKTVALFCSLKQQLKKQQYKVHCKLQVKSMYFNSEGHFFVWKEHCIGVIFYSLFIFAQKNMQFFFKKIMVLVSSHAFIYNFKKHIL